MSTLDATHAQAQSSCITNDAESKDCIILPHEFGRFPIIPGAPHQGYRFRILS